MKKIIALVLAAIMSLTVLSACGTKENLEDWELIESKGEMVIGITLFSPMNYYDEDGNLTGFETEFATAVCEKLGVEPVFQEIDWATKETELNSGNIDCIWNGMTITDERKETMDISVPYMENKQVAVALSDNAANLTSADALSGAIVVAEAGYLHSC